MTSYVLSSVQFISSDSHTHICDYFKTPISLFQATMVQIMYLTTTAPTLYNTTNPCMGYGRYLLQTLNCVCTFTLQSKFSKTVMLNCFCTLVHIVTIGSYYFRNVSGLLPNSFSNIRCDLRKIHSFNIILKYYFIISDSELVSPVLSSALWCEQSQCVSSTNHLELVHIFLHHRPVKVRCMFSAHNILF